MYAFVFPGQGSQVVGMGKDFYETFPAAREVFQRVDDALGQHLSRLAFNGPDDALTQTENTQPALMMVSCAIMAALAHEWGRDPMEKVSLLAGHSLGEYTACTVGGGFFLEDGARVLRVRGDAMKRALPQGEGGMLALLGVTIEQAETIAQEATKHVAGETANPSYFATVANDNAQGQVVLSGHTVVMNHAIAIAKSHGASRAIPLQVSAPFHSSLMTAAAKDVLEALQAIDIQKLHRPLLCNAWAKTVQDPDAVQEALVAQITSRVRWRESVQTFRDLGVTRVLEVGPGKVLSNLVKRIDPEIEIFNIQTVKDLDQFLRGF